VVEGSWPTGRFSAEAPEIVAHAVEVAARLQAALAGKNKTKLSERAETKRSTLYDVLSGLPGSTPSRSLSCRPP
jgi:hypothetical protein